MNIWPSIQRIAILVIGIPILAGLACFQSAQGKPAWTAQAQASGYDKERVQVILFQSELQGGQRIDRDDPYLPPIIDAEARHGRAENYDRCKVAVDTYKQTGQVVRVDFNHPTKLFSVQVGGQRWAEEGADEVVLQDLACFFAAGDVRRTLVFPVDNENGKRLGTWRHGRYIEGAEEW